MNLIGGTVPICINAIHSVTVNQGFCDQPI